jgi:hypothetical protein
MFLVVVEYISGLRFIARRGEGNARGWHRMRAALEESAQQKARRIGRASCQSIGTVRPLGLADRALEKRLGGLAGFAGHLGERALHVLGIIHERFEALARKGGLQLDRIGNGRDRKEIAGELEGRLGVGAGSVESLELHVANAFAGALECLFEDVRGLFGNGLHAAIGVARLREALLGERAEHLRHFEGRRGERGVGDIAGGRSGGASSPVGRFRLRGGDSLGGLGRGLGGAANGLGSHQ